MPAFGDHLSRQEIIDVLTYIKSLWGDKTKRGLSIRESQALVSERDPFPMEEEQSCGGWRYGMRLIRWTDAGFCWPKGGGPG